MGATLQVAYHTLIGDCCRFKAALAVMEVADRVDAGKQAAAAYEAAFKAAKDGGLEAAHPALLRAALNYAVCASEVVWSCLVGSLVFGSSLVRRSMG